MILDLSIPEVYAWNLETEKRKVLVYQELLFMDLETQDSKGLRWVLLALQLGMQTLWDRWRVG